MRYMYSDESTLSANPSQPYIPCNPSYHYVPPITIVIWKEIGWWADHPGHLASFQLLRFYWSFSNSACFTGIKPFQEFTSSQIERNPSYHKSISASSIIGLHFYVFGVAALLSSLSPPLTPFWMTIMLIMSSLNIPKPYAVTHGHDKLKTVQARLHTLCLWS